MPNFAYQAVDTTGRARNGEATAVSVGALTKSLEERGLLVLDVAETRAGTATSTKGFRLGRKREILEVTRALASLLPVGMPLAQALQAASNVATGDVRAAILEV